MSKRGNILRVQASARARGPGRICLRLHASYINFLRLQNVTHSRRVRKTGLPFRSTVLKPL
ncbi:hypothetical protein BJX63DRAFT_388242 [Aspergillus granulosus]|uniref:Uncharacterized protein n=1 Tax=Aspergillus granulosus TaxID=176169 RepID=A0ABR4HL20_9EURO